MDRKTNEYTLSFEPRMAVLPGVTESVLAHTIQRCPRDVTASGTLDGVPYLRFRAEDDAEAGRVAAKMSILGKGPSEGKPRFASVELRTGLGMYRRTVPII